MHSIGKEENGLRGEQDIAEEINEPFDNLRLGEMSKSCDTIGLKEDDERPIIEILCDGGTSDQYDEKQNQWPLPCDRSYPMPLAQKTENVFKEIDHRV